MALVAGHDRPHKARAEQADEEQIAPDVELAADVLDGVVLWGHQPTLPP